MEGETTVAQGQESGRHEAPTLDTFVVSAGEFRLSVLDWIYRLREAAQEVEAAGGDHRAYLARLIAMIEDEHNVHLTYGEADWFNDNLDAIFAKKKQKRAEDIRATLTWPTTTGSTPLA